MRIIYRGLGAAALTASLALAGCSSQGDLQQLNQNEFTLRGMIASDRQQIDSLQQQIRRQGDEITELKHGATGASGDASSSNDRFAKLEAEVASLKAGLTASPGFAPPSPGDSSGAGAPLAPLAMTAPGAAPLPATGRPAPAVTAEMAPTWPNELDQEIAAAKNSGEPGLKLYRSGLDAMKNGKYPLAVANFTKLQHSFPKSELSEPAEYFAANALFETGKYDQAILQFNDLVMRYPKGRFASPALLREAQAFLKLNDRIDARLTLQKLAADHPGTPQASGADTMLKNLASD